MRCGVIIDVSEVVGGRMSLAANDNLAMYCLGHRQTARARCAMTLKLERNCHTMERKKFRLLGNVEVNLQALLNLYLPKRQSNCIRSSWQIKKKIHLLPSSSTTVGCQVSGGKVKLSKFFSKKKLIGQREILTKL